jgi:hypothetical protein
VAQVEADRLAHEHLERHLVDGGPVRVHMLEGVNVGTDVIEHGDEVGLERHRVTRDAEVQRR